MITISTNQASERWDSVSLPLREALCSDTSSDFLWATCQSENVPPKKIPTIAKIASYVLLGFLHPEDVGREIQEEVGLDPKTSLSLQQAFTQRIFSPIRSEIDQAYSPLSKIEIANMQKTTPTPSAPAPKIISESFSATAKFGGTPLASNRDIAAPAPQPPKPAANAAGWSKATPQQPVVKLGAITPSTAGAPTAPTPTVPAPTPAPTPKTISMPSAPAAPKPAAPARTMSEFERLDLMKKGQQPQTAGATTAPPKPAPVMLHEVSSFAPTAQQGSSAFAQKQPAQDQLRGTTAQGPMPTRPAVVEFGAGASSAAQKSNATPYAGYKPPAPPMAAANSGPRQMTEIQPPAASPSPATPPMPPAPPAPPTSKDKVIVKDFLGSQP